MAKPKNDLTGLVFGELTVIRKDEPYRTPNGIPFAKWICKCSCGTIKSVRASHLLSGKTKSCGCKKSEYLADYHKKNNEYENNGEYTKVYTSDKQDFFIVDTDDVERIKDFYWSIENNGYPINTKTGIRLHRYLMSYPKDMYVDHISGDKRDNRRSNLRVCTPQQNSFNRHSSLNNKTGVIGVHQNERGKFVAQIGIDHHRYHLGIFETCEEAEIARKEAEEELYGEFSAKKHQERKL